MPDANYVRLQEDAGLIASDTEWIKENAEPKPMIPILWGARHCARIRALRITHLDPYAPVGLSLVCCTQAGP